MNKSAKSKADEERPAEVVQQPKKDDADKSASEAVKKKKDKSS